MATFVSRREFNYGEATYDRTHVFAVNYLWDVPGGHFGKRLLKAAIGGWQISGITRIQSGAPLSLASGYGLSAACQTGANCVPTTNFGTDITGGGDMWRPVMSANPVLSADKRGVDGWFDTSVFSPPALAGQVTTMAGVQRVLALGTRPTRLRAGRVSRIRIWRCSRISRSKRN